MKKIFKIEFSLKKDVPFNTEIVSILKQVIFLKISMLEDYYLKGGRHFEFSSHKRRGKSGKGQTSSGSDKI